MAYETSDIYPASPAEKTSPGSPHEGSPKLEGSSASLIHKGLANDPPRPGDSDISPGPRSPVVEVAISRLPDTKAGWKCGYEVRSEGDGDDASYSPFLRLMAWVVGGGFVLWLYFQLSGLVKTTLEYSCRYTWCDWQFWIAWALPITPVLALLYVAWKVYRFSQVLPAYEQVHGDLHTSDVDKKGELQDLLKPYIFGLQKNKNYVAAFKSGEDRQRISEEICKLCDDSCFSDVGGWVDVFERFQKCQEDRAYEVVKKYCQLVALKTAACPWKFIDMVIVFVNLTLMIEKIALVYNRRVLKEGAFRLLCRWFMNIYISGELGAITENVSNQASDKVADWLTNVKDVTNGQPMAGGAQSEGFADLFSASLPILSKVVGKVAEGGMNAYLAYRMGKRAIEEFRFFVPAANGNDH